MKIYCFGNEFLENDSLAKNIVDSIDIEDVEFIKCDDPSEILLEEEIIILDVAEGIEDVMLIEDIDQLKNSSITSLHDFDLSFFLKLMKRIDQLKKVKIIAIPMKGDVKDKIENMIRSLKHL